ncbi:TetR/AcrR family transcriptional regulator [Hymenobacter sp. H14-R3]|uniref:TetR/AcrR family transcriptional regulator n=1 Tax=Hymenobacter sp. H14-R3 TaxID=3046308 RepID=UPI0024B9E369|nr:TetR/AcrR family transcriptional regulator [Hymenobacter sp. H14-R3]MDJ0367823.1 TetR/AcrR family transcriptional regulator [Hymenobacter sp. H14-R3]
MSTTERKKQEKHQRRQLILDAAQHLFVEQGFEKVSMRNIAEATNYSATAVYHYFADKSALLYALQSRAFERLAQQADAVEQIESPVGRLRALGHTYLGFAAAHPELFELMFLMTSPMDAVRAQAGPATWASGRAAFDRMVQVMQYGIEAGVFPYADAELIALVAWGQLHGLAALALGKRLSIFPEARRAGLVEEAMELFIKLVIKK